MTPLPRHVWQHGLIDYHGELPPSGAGQRNTGLQVGKVTKPDDNEGYVHIRMFDGMRYYVQDSSPFAGTKHGSWRNHKLRNVVAGEDQNGPLDTFAPTDTHDTYAIIGFLDGRSDGGVVVNYLLPQKNQMNGEGNSSIDRHTTDFVTIMNDDGMRSTYAADGSGMTYAPDSDGQDKDRPYFHDPGNAGIKNYDYPTHPWQIEKSHDNAITLSQQSGNSRVKMWTDGRISMQMGNDAVIQIHKEGHVSITTNGVHCINAPTTTITGDLFVNGNVSCPGSIVASSGSVPGPLGGGGAGSAGPVVTHNVGKSTLPWNSIPKVDG